ncbi:MAG: hypothetical protein ACLUFN_02075 [Eubacterium sp.]
MNLRMNGEYIITNSVNIDDCEFVLGVSTESPSMFATWECEGGNYYFSGQYHNDLYSAQKDLVRRCQKEIERIDYIKNMAKTEKKTER